MLHYRYCNIDNREITVYIRAIRGNLTSCSLLTTKRCHGEIKVSKAVRARDSISQG